MSMNLDSLVPEQGDRDELIQLLNLIAIQWHQNAEAFEQRRLADWPQWCEDQGLRVEVLQAFALKLEATLIAPAGTSTISQQIRSLGSNATVSQLLDSFSEHSPHLLKAFEEVLQSSQEAVHTLDDVAGGTGGKWMKDHPWVDTAGVVGVAGVTAIGIGTYRRIQRKKKELADQVRADADQARAGVDSRTQTIEELIESVERKSSDGGIAGSDLSRVIPRLDKYNANVQRVIDNEADNGLQRLFSRADRSSSAEKLESEAKSEVQSFSDELTQRAKSEVYSVASEEEEILDATIIHALRTSLDKEIERMEDKMIHTAEEDLSPEIKRIKEDIEVIDNI